MTSATCHITDMICVWSFFITECTFIILDKSALNKPTDDEIQSMVGDVNLFFNDTDDPHSAELEIMVAGITLYIIGILLHTIYLGYFVCHSVRNHTCHFQLTSLNFPRRLDSIKINKYSFIHPTAPDLALSDTFSLYSIRQT